jgi:hypothetical protein
MVSVIADYAVSRKAQHKRPLPQEGQLNPRRDHLPFRRSSERTSHTDATASVQLGAVPADRR